MYNIGLDIHKKDTQDCVLDTDGKLVCNERIITDVSDIGHFFEVMDAKVNKLKVILEATGFYLQIYNVIKE